MVIIFDKFSANQPIYVYVRNIEAPLAHYVTYDVTPETDFDTKKLQQKTIEYKINEMR